MAEARDYFLTGEQLRARFEERVRDFVFSGHSPQDRPVLILGGGQPAAGKSHAMAAAEQRRRDRDLVPLTGDVLRVFHPQYELLLREEPQLFPNATAQASGAWVRMSIEYALAHRYSLLLEGVFRSPVMVVATATEFADTAYEVEVLGLGVRAERSRLDSLYRYLESGRWTPPTAHDGAYTMMPETIAAAEASPAVHRLTLTDRTGVDLYVNERDASGLWLAEPAGVAALQAIRARPLPPEEAAGWLARHHETLLTFAGRGEISEDTLPALRAVTQDADTVAAMAPERSAARREYDATRPLLRALVSQPVTSVSTLPLPLVPGDLLAFHAARSAAQVAQEETYRSALPAADREAQEAFRSHLVERLRSMAAEPPTAEPRRPSAAAARSRSTTVRRTPGTQTPPVQRSAEQPPHLRHQAGPDRDKGKGPNT